MTALCSTALVMMWLPLSVQSCLPGDAAYGQVVAFAAAGSEHDFGRAGVEDGGNGAASFVQRLFGYASLAVNAGSVAEVFTEIGQHCFQHQRRDRRGGGMVEIDGAGGSRYHGGKRIRAKIDDRIF